MNHDLCALAGYLVQPYRFGNGEISGYSTLDALNPFIGPDKGVWVEIF
jgi:hypothetical protein